MFVRKSKYDELQEKLADKTAELNDLKEQYASLEKSLQSDECMVCMKISDDLDTITPIVKFHGGISEQLVLNHYLKDTDVSPHSIQLALMMIAGEGIEQIVSSFQGGIDE